MTQALRSPPRPEASLIMVSIIGRAPIVIASADLQAAAVIVLLLVLLLVRQLRHPLLELAVRAHRLDLEKHGDRA